LEAILSLFDPQGQKEILDTLLHDRTQGSGEAIIELPYATKKHLEAELLKIGAKIAQTGDKQAGFEEAYSAFAETFHGNGAPLAEGLLQVDIPNMLFNYAVRNGWFPNLGSLADHSELSDITSPKRIAHEKLAVRGGLGGLTAPGKQESIGWFKDQVRPAVLQWRAKAIESHLTKPGSHNATEAHPINISRRRRWLEAEFAKRGWTTGDLSRHGGPDRKTTEVYLSGKDIGVPTRKKIVDALNQKRDGDRLIDISELPE
jgi:hypothetical protein